jgi:mono/diheme cytochrome c family protein
MEMRKLFKFGLGGAAGLAVIAGGLAAFAEIGSETKMHRHVAIDVPPIALASDQESLARGAYLYKSRGCAECHGADGGGKIVIDDGGFHVKAPNIVPSGATATANYKPEDWVRTIRHGVKPNGEPVFVMPSEDFNRLTDADVGAIIGYIKSLPPVSGTPAEIRVPLIVRFLYAAGAVKDAAEKIDHTLPPQQPISNNDEVAHGAYVAAACKGCHNDAFSGGAIPGAPPSWPSAANLTSGSDSVLTRYPDAAALMAMFRSGRRPDGSAVSTVMPFGMLKEISDDDASALYAFLKTLPAAKHGERPS